MYLKSLKLAGFKSFANPTTLHFGRHIHAIVGPNGCGKSNVIDAIRWVLGESHAKQLRGAAMSDVIFAGTEGKAGRSVASVELLLAHTQDDTHGIRHALNLYDELSIRRQVTKEGKSTYFINGQKVRRQDVVDVFLGTGLSSRGYAVIEQGMIGRIVEADGQSLRRFIEEAAGVSRYQARLNDTQKQLATAKDNLARLYDVQHELKTKQKHLTEQAKTACRYEELSIAIQHKKRALYQARLFTAWQTHQHHLTQSNDLATQKQGLKRQLDELAQQQSDQQARIKTLTQQKQQSAEQLHKLQLKAQALLHSHQQAQAELDHAKQALSLLDDSTNAPTAGDINVLISQLDELNQAILVAKEQKNRQDDAWQSTKAALDGLTQQHQTLKNQLAVAQGSLKQLTHTAQNQPPLPTITPPSDDPHALAVTIDELQAKLTALQQTKSKQKNDLEAQQELIKATTKAYDQLDKTQAILSAEYDTLRSLLTPSDDTATTETIAQQIILSKEGRRYAKALDGGFGFLWQDKCATRIDEHDNYWWLAADDTDAHTQSQHPDIIPLSGLILVPSLWVFVAGYLVDGLVLDDIPDDEMYQYLCQFVTGVPSGFVVGERFFHRFGVMATSTTALQRHIDQQQHLDELAANINDVSTERAELACQLEQQKNTIEALIYEHSEQVNAENALQQTLSATQQRHDLAVVAIERERYAKQMHDELTKQRLYLDHELARQKEACHRLSDELSVLTPRLDEAKRRFDEVQQRGHQQKKQLARLYDDKNSLQATLAQQQNQRALAQKNAKKASSYHSQVASLTPVLRTIDQEQKTLAQVLQNKQDDHDKHDQSLIEVQERYGVLQHERVACEAKMTALTDKISHTQTLVAVALAKVQDHGETLTTLDEGFELTKALDEFYAHPNPPKPDEASLKRKLDDLQKQLDGLGAVNLAAKAELDELNARLVPQLAQSVDIENSIKTLQNASKTISQQSKKRFMATLEAVNATFGALFATVFEGGQASLQLEESDLPAGERWQAGLVLMAQPKGKKNSRLAVLSGGEKTLTALSLIFAIFKQNPAPFCVLDEVDAPLDDANVARFTELVKELAQQVQFIFISHNKLAMMCADELTGITMPNAGISSVVAVDLQAAAMMVETK